ncbi:MAG: DUF5683 domain-containing protein [Bacteroidota bacterium]
MARRWIFFLVIGLGFGHTPAAWAIQPQPTPVSKSTSVQSNEETPIAPATQTPPTESLGALPEAKETLPGAVEEPAAPLAQSKIKQLRQITEEMTTQRAWIYSAIVPGWGQLYNRHYWKVPAMYAVFAGLGWGAIYNHQEYIEAKKACGGNEGSYQLRNDVHGSRRTRDIFCIFMGLLYAANIFDAYIGASLKTFNLSDDISVEVQPNLIPTAQAAPTAGLSLTFKF